MSFSRISGYFAIGLSTVALSLACSGQDSVDGEVTAPPDPASPATIAQQVVADFLSVPIAEVAVVSTAAQEFNDSSLGCPEPGMSYLQALTPGHRVIVEAEGRRFDIRVSGGHGKICHRQKPGKNPSKPSITSPTSELTDR